MPQGLGKRRLKSIALMCEKACLGSAKCCYFIPRVKTRPLQHHAAFACFRRVQSKPKDGERNHRTCAAQKLNLWAVSRLKCNTERWICGQPGVPGLPTSSTVLHQLANLLIFIGKSLQFKRRGRALTGRGPLGMSGLSRVSKACCTSNLRPG